jgi:hypothetical protein
MALAVQLISSVFPTPDVLLAARYLVDADRGGQDQGVVLPGRDFDAVALSRSRFRKNSIGPLLRRR